MYHGSKAIGRRVMEGLEGAARRAEMAFSLVGREAQTRMASRCLASAGAR